MSYLRYLCSLAHSGVQHILCCVFALGVFVYAASFSVLSISIVLSVFSTVHVCFVRHGIAANLLKNNDVYWCLSPCR